MGGLQGSGSGVGVWRKESPGRFGERRVQGGLESGRG